MIKIAITEAAFAAIASTLPLGYLWAARDRLIPDTPELPVPASRACPRPRPSPRAPIATPKDHSTFSTSFWRPRARVGC